MILTQFVEQTLCRWFNILGNR